MTPAKRRRIRRVALGYLLEHPESLDAPCRFDVVAVEFGEDGRPVLRHIRDAF